MNLLELNCVFKSVSKKDGGEFTNDKGQVIKYDPSYIIKIDDDVNGEITERKLKFPLTNKTLYNKLNELDSYSNITLICDVQLFTGNAKVLPVDIK